MQVQMKMHVQEDVGSGTGEYEVAGTCEDVGAGTGEDLGAHL